MFRRFVLIFLCIALLFELVGSKSSKKAELKKKLFFSNIQRSGETIQRNCSVSRSAIVRKILIEEFNPIYERYSVDVPHSCPLKVERSVYNLLEQSKTEQSSGFWKCEKCGKRFYAEQFVYNHMSRKHVGDVFQLRKGFICLATFCDIFRCDLHEKYPIVRTEYPECNAQGVRELQRKCEKLVNKCLPHNTMRHHVYDALQKSLCAPLNCESFYTRFEDLKLSTVVLCAFLAPCIILMLYIGCCYYWETWVSDVPDESWSSKENTKMERLRRLKDARNAAITNKGMYRYHGYNLRRR